MGRRYSEIPKGYDVKGDSKDIKYSGKRHYSAEQVARRIRNPKELSGDYESRATYHKSMEGIHEMGDRNEDYESAAKHRKKADIYRLISKKAKKGSSVSEEEISELEKIFARIGVFAIISLLGSIFFLQSNITGNVVGLSLSSTNFIGGFLFLLGITGALLYFKHKK